MRGLYKRNRGGCLSGISILASKKYVTTGYSYDTLKHSGSYQSDFSLPYTWSFYYPPPEYAKESQSLYTGFLIKLSHLNTFYYKVRNNKFFRVSGGLDAGYYLLRDQYKTTIENYYTKNDRYITGVFNSNAVSLGGVVDFKKSIYKNWFINLFAQGMFYFNNIPSQPLLYEQDSPFAYWKLEVGVGMGYSFIH